MKGKNASMLYLNTFPCAKFSSTTESENKPRIL